MAVTKGTYTYVGPTAPGPDPVTGQAVVAPVWQTAPVQAAIWTGNAADQVALAAAFGLTVVPSPSAADPAGSVVVEAPAPAAVAATQRYLLRPGYRIVVGTDGSVVVFDPPTFNALFSKAAV